MKRKKTFFPATVMSVLGMLWLALFPLWQDFSFSRITAAKWTGALVLCCVTVLAVGMLALLLGSDRQLRRHIRLHPAQALAGAYFLWVALSALFGRMAATLNANGQLAVWMGSLRYEGLLTQLCYGLIFFAMSLLPLKVKPVVHAAAVALLIFCGVVALQYLGLNPLGLFPEGRSIYTNYEFQGTIGNIDMVSGYLTLVVPLLLGGFVLSDKDEWLWLVSGTLGVCLMACIEVQSGLIAIAVLAGLMVMLMLYRAACRTRGLMVLAGMALAFLVRSMLLLPWLDSVETLALTFTPLSAGCLLAAAAFFMLSRLAAKKPGKSLSGKAVLILTAACLAAVLLAIALLPIPSTAGGLWELHEVLQGRAQVSFGSYRMGVWQYTLDMAKDSLLFGTGPDTFYFAMRSYLTEHGLTLPENFDNPHNEYLAILANNGLPALLIYLALLGVVIHHCLRCGCQQPWLWALGGAVVCFAVQGFFSFSICLVSPMFWAVMGMCAALKD